MLIDGFAPGDLLAIPELDELVLNTGPVVFQINKAQVLAEFSLPEKRRLLVEIASVEGGQGGVLRTLFRTIEAAAKARRMQFVDWEVFAANCANPNPKIVPLLEAFQFKLVRSDSGVSFYHRRVSMNDTVFRHD